MKKHILILVLCLISSAVVAQTMCKYNDSGQPLFCDANGDFYNGVAKGTASWGETIEVSFVNGERVFSKTTDGQGRPVSTTSLKNGEFDGPNKRYEDGILVRESNYKDGKIDGEQKSYYKNGKLRSIETYKNSTIVGVSKYYYENGNLQREDTFDNGVMIYTEFYDEKTGKLTQEQGYKDNKIINPKWYK